VKTRKRCFGRAHGSARLSLRLENQYLAAGARENNACGQTIEARSDDDDVVAQDSIRLVLDAKISEFELFVVHQRRSSALPNDAALFHDIGALDEVGHFIQIFVDHQD